MRVSGKQLVGAVVFGLLALGSPAVAGSDQVSSGHEAEATAVIRDVHSKGDTITGTIVNNSHRPLREVRLLIRHGWLWKNERHPGTDNPGRTDRYVVPGEVPAGGSLPFTYVLDPPLPDRQDGHFVTTVELVGFTEVGF